MRERAVKTGAILLFVLLAVLVVGTVGSVAVAVDDLLDGLEELD